jgi:predicted nucleic acid-binding protein
VVWYLDTAAFMKLVVDEPESEAMRSWFLDHGTNSSSHLLRTEALRAANRLGLDRQILDAALETVSLVLPAASTFRSAGMLEPSDLRSLDALHLATALELGTDLEGLVTYDDRLGRAASAASIQVVAPR